MNGVARNALPDYADGSDRFAKVSTHHESAEFVVGILGVTCLLVRIARFVEFSMAMGKICRGPVA